MITRRRFVAATLGAGAALATQGCATTPTASKRRIVDTRVHLWTALRPDWQWA